jgi:hypothetical protein
MIGQTEELMMDKGTRDLDRAIARERTTEEIVDSIHRILDAVSRRLEVQKMRELLQNQRAEERRAVLTTDIMKRLYGSEEE